MNLSLLLLSLLVIGILHDRLLIPKLIAKACAPVLTVCVGFAVNRLWVFK